MRENSSEIVATNSKISVPIHGCCRAVLSSIKILASKRDRDNEWGLDDHDLRAVLSRADGTKVRAHNAPVIYPK